MPGSPRSRRARRSTSAPERVQAALYRIAEAASAAPATCRRSIARSTRPSAELMFAENFYIALYDDAAPGDQLPVLRRHGRHDIPDPAVWEPFGVGNAPRLDGLRPADRAARCILDRRVAPDA